MVFNYDNVFFVESLEITEQEKIWLHVQPPVDPSNSETRKRLNPLTGKPFVKGEEREDGYKFWAYNKTAGMSRKGFYYESWRSPKQFEKIVNDLLEWQSENKDRMQINYMKCNMKRKKRLPKWLNEEDLKNIDNLYKRTKIIKKFTGELWEVDHIIPLNGKNVSGLHVPSNLQLLPKKENRDKRNKWEVT
jgi:hypothetical protein